MCWVLVKPPPLTMEFRMTTPCTDRPPTSPMTRPPLGQLTILFSMTRPSVVTVQLPAYTWVGSVAGPTDCGVGKSATLGGPVGVGIEVGTRVGLGVDVGPGVGLGVDVGPGVGLDVGDGLGVGVVVGLSASICAA